MLAGICKTRLIPSDISGLDQTMPEPAPGLQVAQMPGTFRPEDGLSLLRSH